MSREVELQRQVSTLRREVADLKIALQTSNEHGDLLHEHLYHLSASLQAEVRERRATEQVLQKLVQAARQEKADLEILVQILAEQGDNWAEEGSKAKVDALTQIANRWGFDECLKQEWHRHFQTGQPLSLIVVDVDCFKQYNDLYGHQAGDECLRVVAKTINVSLRVSDFAARYGGEEFAVVLPCTNKETALQIAERVRSAVECARIPHDASLVSTNITVSIGAACRVPAEAGANARDLIEEADQCLYVAKRRGRNRIVASGG